MKINIFIFLILLISILIFYKLLYTGFWFSELFQFWYSDPKMNLIDIWNKRWFFDYHLPFFHFITWTWFNLTTYTEFSANVFTALSYCLSLFLFFIFIKINKNFHIPIEFYFLWACLPPIIFHASEFRMYFYLAYFSLIYFYITTNLIENNNAETKLLTPANIFIATIISLLHYWGCLIVFSVGLYLFLFKTKKIGFINLVIFHLIPLFFVIIILAFKIKQILCCYIDDPSAYTKTYTLFPAIKVFLYSIVWKSKKFALFIFLLFILNIIYLIFQNKLYKIIKDEKLWFSIIVTLIGFITAYLIEYYLHIWKPYTAIGFSPFIFYIFFVFINNSFLYYNFILILIFSLYFGPLLKETNKSDWKKPAEYINNMKNCEKGIIFSSLENNEKSDTTEFFNNFYFKSKEVKILSYDIKNFVKNVNLIINSNCNAILYAPHTSKSRIVELYEQLRKFIEDIEIIEIEKDRSYVIIKK